jgi:hypothetical protein
VIERNYLDIPKRLLIDIHDNVLALALYHFVARLFVATGGAPVPLSRGDVQRYDPTVKDGAFKRAMARLIAEGWLIPSGSYKGTYIPSWGLRRDAASLGPYTRHECYPWTVGAPLLGCPKHIAAEALRIDRSLLDLFLGRLIPGRRFSRIERFVTSPLLTLAEVGAYLAARGGYAISDDQVRALRRWGLWRDGLAVAELPSEREVLALVSQRATPDGPRLTEAGWRRAGLLPSQAAPANQEGQTAGVPLFFVPKEQVGALIPTWSGELIGPPDDQKDRFAAPTSAESEPHSETPNMTGNHSESSDSRDLLPQPPHASTEPAGGGCMPSTRHKSIPDTPAARLLAEIGCYPSSVAELATMPVEQVGGAIAYAKGQPNITSVAAWTVDALRKMRDEGWTLPSEGTPGAGAGAERWTSQRTAQIADSAGGLFRLGSDTSDLDDTNVRCKISGRPGRSPDLEGEDAAPPAAQARPRGRAASPVGTPTAPGRPTDIGTERDATEGRHNVAAPDAVAAPPGQAGVTPGATPVPDRANRSNGAMYNAKGTTPAPAAGPPAAPAAQGDADAARAYVLSRQAREELRKRCDRGHHNTIAGIQLQPARDRTIVTCANRADRSTVSGVLIGALRQVVKELGLPTELEIVVQAAPPVAAHRWATEPHGGLQ